MAPLWLSVAYLVGKNLLQHSVPVMLLSLIMCELKHHVSFLFLLLVLFQLVLCCWMQARGGDPGRRCWSLTSSDESNDFSLGGCTCSGWFRCRCSVGDDLQDLVMMPAVAPLRQGFRAAAAAAAAAENMLLGSSPLAQRAYAEEINVIHSLDQELDVVGLCFPKLMPMTLFTPPLAPILSRFPVASFQLSGWLAPPRLTLAPRPVSLPSYPFPSPCPGVLLCYYQGQPKRPHAHQCTVTKSCVTRENSAASAAFHVHFWPILTWTPAWETFGSLDSWYCTPPL